MVLDEAQQVAQEKLARLLAVYPNSPRHPVTRHVRKSPRQWELLRAKLPPLLDALPTEVGSYRMWAKHLTDTADHGFPWPVRRLLWERAPAIAVSLALSDLTTLYVKEARGLSPGAITVIARRLQEPTRWNEVDISGKLTVLRVQTAEQCACRAPWSWLMRLLEGVPLTARVDDVPDPVVNRLIRAATRNNAPRRKAYYAALLPHVEWEAERPDRALVLSLFTSAHAYRQPDATDQPLWAKAWAHARPELRSAVLFQGMVRKEKWDWLAQLDDPTCPLQVEAAVNHPLWTTAPATPAMFWSALDDFDAAPGHADLKVRLWASLTPAHQAMLPKTLARHRQEALSGRPPTPVANRRRRT